MRVIVAGAADWTDGEAIARELAKLPPDATVIHGDAPGADALAGAAAARLGFRMEPMAKNREDYARYKRGGLEGPQRADAGERGGAGAGVPRRPGQKPGDQAPGRTGPGGGNRSAGLRGVAGRDNAGSLEPAALSQERVVASGRDQQRYLP